MAETTDRSTIVLLDDELYNMMWLIDYLQGRKYDVLTARTANEALELLSKKIYRCAILDLNVPLFDPLLERCQSLGEVYGRFPGLFVAREARNFGYRDRQIIIYSVHRDPMVTAEANKLSCTYILKGRPRVMKEELEEVLMFDPTDHS